MPPETQSAVNNFLNYVYDQLPGKGSARFKNLGQKKQSALKQKLQRAIDSSESDPVIKLITLSKEILSDRKNNPLLKNRGTHGYFWKSAFSTKLRNPIDGRFSRSTTEDKAIHLHKALYKNYINDHRYQQYVGNWTLGTEIAP